MIDLNIAADNYIAKDFNSNRKIPTKESISYIFMDNLNEIRSIYNSGKMRNITYDNIQKVILCGSYYLGHDIYECPVCHKETIIPRGCHSRFCTKCGSKETKVRAAKISSMCLDAHHRHIVFTIPKELRNFFLKDRRLLNLLFIASRNTMMAVFNNEKFRKSKSKNKFRSNKNTTTSNYIYRNEKNRIIPGMIMTLHTFGRDLKWNPHIHCLVCEEAYNSKTDKMKSFSFMSYEKLRKTWMYTVLDILSRENLGTHYNSIKRNLYRINEDGFYVYAKKRDNEEDDNVEECVKYITRYTSRPPMAESRIIKYDDVKKEIWWWYNRHEDDQYVEVHQHAIDFIKQLILHCPEENFKMVRYYGFYSNRFKYILDKIYELYGRKVHRHIRSRKERKHQLKNKLAHLKYRTLMIESYSRDPIKCSCGATMYYRETYDPFEGGTINDRLYREKCINETRTLARGSSGYAWT